MSVDCRHSRGTLNAMAFCLFGPLVWALHFAIVYGVHHVVCRAAPAASGGVHLTVVGATAGTLLVLGFAALKPGVIANALRCPPSVTSEPFYYAIMRWLILLGACGIAWAGAAAFVLDVCRA